MTAATAAPFAEATEPILPRATSEERARLWNIGLPGKGTKKLLVRAESKGMLC